jgi:hypothetical protein
MSPPVTTDDIVQGAVKYLVALTDIKAVLGAETDGTPWLFQHTLWVTMEQSQGTAAVIQHAGGWAGANEHNTLRFPRLGLEIWADPIRDSGGNVTAPGETQRRIQAAYDAFDKRLHRPAPATQMWGTVRTVSCVRLGEPTIYLVPDGDGLLRLQGFYAVTQG